MWRGSLEAHGSRGIETEEEPTMLQFNGPFLTTELEYRREQVMRAYPRTTRRITPAAPKRPGSLRRLQIAVLRWV